MSEPDVGKILSFTLNEKIKIRANQKLGKAWPITERNKAILSIMLLGLIAAATPSGTAKIIAKLIAKTPNVIVVGNHSTINSVTGI